MKRETCDYKAMWKELRDDINDTISSNLSLGATPEGMSLAKAAFNDALRFMKTQMDLIAQKARREE